MSLSENEQKILQELESQLRAEDPGLDRRVSRHWRGPGSSHLLVRPALLFVTGLVLLLMLTFSPVPAVIGTALMLVAIVQGAKTLSEMARAQTEQARSKAAHRDEG